MKESDSKQEPYSGVFAGWAIAIGFFVSVGTELYNPEFANFLGFVVAMLILTFASGGIGATVDAVISQRRKSAIPLNFINYLWRNALPRVSQIISDDLTFKANECVKAFADSIKFQQEELSGNGRAAEVLGKEEIEKTREVIAGRVKKARDDFYGSYDTIAPFADKFGGLKERSFKAYATASQAKVA